MSDICDPQHNALWFYSDVIHPQFKNKIMSTVPYVQDQQQAQQMEQFLRQIKLVARSIDENSNTSGIESIIPSMDSYAYSQLEEIIGESFNLLNAARQSSGKVKLKKASTLFRREHSAGHKGKNDSDKATYKIWQVDDVFEAELYSILQAIEKKALGKKYGTITLGSSTTGQSSGVVKGGVDTLQTILKDTVNLSMDELKEQLLKKGYSSKQIAKILSVKLEAKSGKTDIEGFNLNFDGQIDPKWMSMVSIFKGAHMTLKNYTSRTEQEEVKIGNSSSALGLGATIPRRAFYGALGYLGYKEKDIGHIYYHGLNSYNKYGGEALKTHAFHIRFLYELTGVGLYDENGNALNSANFLVYNDPYSDNIYVRSTRKILADLIDPSLNATTFLGEPFVGEIKIKKSYFIP